MLASANALLKTTLTSSKLHVDGSPEAADVHETVVNPPEVAFVSGLSVNAETKGAARARKPSLENTLETIVVS